jgi:uncharacterized protein DUF6325
LSARTGAVSSDPDDAPGTGRREDWQHPLRRSVDRTAWRFEARATGRTKETGMSIGPVEYMVVAFPGNQFNGRIAPALADLVEAGTIRVLDLAIVVKDAAGEVSAMEIEGAGSAVMDAFEALAEDRGGLINAEDLAKVGAALEPNSSAALLVWEDLWASRLADEIRAAGGVLVDIKRVPREIVEAAILWNEDNQAEIAAAEAAAASA